MIPFASPLLHAGAAAAAVGQQLFTASTSNFTVPAGVTAISVVAIGAGCGRTPYSGGGYWAGGGGGLAYVNNIAVTPGEVLTVEVQEGNYSRIRRGGVVLCSAGAAVTNEEFNAGPTAGAPIIGTGFVGGGGVWRPNTTANGGGAGGYTSAGGFEGTPISRGGGGSSPLGGTIGGAAGGAPSSAGGTYGGGSAGNSSSGGPGCVRIIWGEGRAFPNTNTQDMT